jgi:hypothetical protein
MIKLNTIIISLFIALVLIHIYIICVSHMKQREKHAIIQSGYNSLHSMQVHAVASESHSGTCSSKGCAGIDPVSDPMYNIKGVVENTLLLEEHLVEDRKYCVDCCCKHFLLCTAYLSESVWLAGKQCDMYPQLKESAKFYNEQFEIWLDNRDDKKVRLDIAEKLRQKRKELVHIYIVNGKELAEKCKINTQI